MFKAITTVQRYNNETTNFSVYRQEESDVDDDNCWMYRGQSGAKQLKYADSCNNILYNKILYFHLPETLEVRGHGGIPAILDAIIFEYCSKIPKSPEDHWFEAQEGKSIPSQPTGVGNGERSIQEMIKAAGQDGLGSASGLDTVNQLHFTCGQSAFGFF